MIEEVLRYLHNWFCKPEEIRVALYSIEDRTISLPFLLEGQYFRIVGSVLNDGIYQYPCTELIDETFFGAVWPMRIPTQMISLVAEIEEWQDKYSSVVSGPYTSESFGGYSYSKGSSSDSGTISSWQDVFESRLAAWRKI